MEKQYKDMNLKKPKRTIVGVREKVTAIKRIAAIKKIKKQGDTMEGKVIVVIKKVPIG